MDGLIIIIMILALAVFSIGIRFLTRRGKAIYHSGESSALELTTFSHEVSGEEADGMEEITISFFESRQQYRWIGSKDSLLEFAESRGIEVESLCRAGECGSCRTKLLEGEVEYHKKPGINPGRGYCLLCISKPRSNLVLKR